MKPWLRYAGLGLLLYGVFLIATFPAVHAYPLFLKDRLAPLRLQGIEGSVWDGQANAAILGAHRLGSLNWEVHPWMLLLGRVELDWIFTKDDGKAQGTLARSLGGNLHFSDITASWPMAEVGSILSVLPIKPAGDLQVDLADMTINGRSILAAQGALAWEDATFMLSKPVMLGNFVMDLDTVNGSIKGILLDRGGALQAQGVLMLKPDGSYQFNGTVALRDDAQPELRQILAFLGTPEADGKVPFSLSGTLPGTSQPDKAQTAMAP